MIVIKNSKEVLLKVEKQGIFNELEIRNCFGMKKIIKIC